MSPNNIYAASSASRILWVFIWRWVSPLGRASHLCHDLASQLNSLSKFVFVDMRGGPATPCPDLAIVCPRSRLGGLEIFHIDASNRAGSRRRTSKSKLRTHDKVLSWPVFFGITFHFTSSVCSGVGYKMTNCGQILACVQPDYTR